MRLVLLTNCTFDGIVYDVERVMMECLAIKPDLVFLWDEAWFAFAVCHPIYRQRTGMASAKRLCEHAADAGLRASAMPSSSRSWAKAAGTTTASCSTLRLMPDPAKARVRVYATQSTHKTLTSLRQGSMIHVWDQDFKDKAEEAFHEAYMTHTSTSPNYQILASLDVGRRQVELEGYELVQRQLELAMTLREQVMHHPLLKKYFRFLRVGDLVPPQYRESGVESYYNTETGWNNMEAAWRTDEFALDPSRATLAIGGTGVDGDTFKNKYLMDKYGIQINKTSRNTVLFMTNIGSTRSAVAYLMEVLVKIARDVDQRVADMSAIERRIHDKRVQLADAGAAAAAGLLGLPFGLPRQHRQRRRRADARRPHPQRLLPVLRRRQLRIRRHGRSRQGHRGRARAGVGAVRHPLPARVPDPGAGADHQRGHPAVHGRTGCARDPRLPPGAGLSHLQRRRAGACERRHSPRARSWPRPATRCFRSSAVRRPLPNRPPCKSRSTRPPPPQGSNHEQQQSHATCPT